MYSNQPVDAIDNVEGGLTREKLIQAFSILGIPVGGDNINSRGEIIDAMSLDELNEPEYWNDRRPAPSRKPRPPLYDPEIFVDAANDTIIEPKTGWDVERNATLI